MNRFTFWSIIGVSAVLGGCAGVNSGPDRDTLLLELNGLATGALQTMPALTEIDGQAAALYGTSENRTVFQHGAQKKYVDESAPVKGGNRFQLNKVGDHLYAQWWSHENAKNLYFTSTRDAGKTFAPVSIVNDDHGILSPIRFLKRSDGVIGMTYHDERLPRFQAFFNRSMDNGQTWMRPDKRLDLPLPNGQSSTVMEPQSVEVDDSWVTAWADSITIDGKTTNRIQMTQSSDGGLNWSAPKAVFESDQYIASLTISANKSVVVVSAAEHERGIHAFVSKDKGLTWSGSGILDGTAAIRGTEGSSNSGIRLALTQDYAHLVWMATSRESKARIMRGRLNLATVHWQGAVERMDTKPYENTMSLVPALIATPSGTLLSAWVDYRDIRPNIFLSWSYDQGQSWAAPQPLEQPGKVSAGLPQLMVWGADAAIGYELYPEERIKEGKFILRLLPINNKEVALPSLIRVTLTSENDRKSLLLKRVKALWESRKSDDYKVSYSMFDYAYRAAVSEKNYIASVGVMTYLSYEEPSFVISGNEAIVTTKVRYEVQPTTLPNGKVLKLDATDAETISTWVWVNDTWFLVYKPSPGDPVLKY